MSSSRSSKVPPRRARWALGLGVSLAILLAATGTASAQPLPLPSPVPWGAGPVVAPPATFDSSWASVLSDTVAKLRVLADLSRYGGPGSREPAVPRTELVPMWRDTRTHIPTNPDLSTLRVGPARAELMPIELTTTQVAAESRGMQGVLIGLQMELPFLP